MVRADDDQHGTAARGKERPAPHRMDNKRTLFLFFNVLIRSRVTSYRRYARRSMCPARLCVGWKAIAGSDTKAWQPNHRVPETRKLKSSGKTKTQDDLRWSTYFTHSSQRSIACTVVWQTLEYQVHVPVQNDRMSYAFLINLCWATTVRSYGECSSASTM